jgi:Flp pilus assembly protein TadG
MKIVNLRDRVVVAVTNRCGAAKAVSAFRRDERGGMLVFGMILFILMIAIGGMAVDLMRHERMRTELQQTLDRCVLAAAGLTQTLDPELVVNDCFVKVGLDQYLEDVQVTTTLNSRKVEALAIADTRPFFMDMMGIDELPAAATSAAEQQINNIEVVLVLDVSGSMTEAAGAKTKIVRLREAATKFIDDILDEDGGDRVSVAIVPYNAQVNLGSVLMDKYNLSEKPILSDSINDVNCVELSAAAFSSADLSRVTAIPKYTWADVNSATNSGSSDSNNSFVAKTDAGLATMLPDQSYCTKTTPLNRNQVRLPNYVAATLKAQIANLSAGGNTSTTLGMRWGLALLDPGARPMFNELANGTDMPASYNVRPFDYDDPDAMKFIVLMTDGIHVAHRIIKTPYKSGLSPIYLNGADGNYSIRLVTNLTGGPLPAQAGTNQYWVPHLVPNKDTALAAGWQSGPWGGPAAVQQTWPQVWDKLRLSYVAWQFYGRALGTSGGSRVSHYNTAMNAMRGDYANAATMDARLQQTCDLARQPKSATISQPKVIVFGIAFQAPAAAQTNIRNCATSTAHYFDAQGAGINDAFDLIANQINYLRLTQ